MSNPKRGSRILSAMVVLFLLGIVSLGWLERASLLSWYNVYQLIRASDTNRESRAQAVASLGEAALPGLCKTLKSSDPNVCANCCAGLSALIGMEGGIYGDRTPQILNDLARSLPHWSIEGQHQVLRMITDLYPSNPPPPTQELLLANARLLTVCAGLNTDQVQDVALHLCSILIKEPHPAEVLGPGRDLIRNYLQSSNPQIRRRAIQAAMDPGLDLLEVVAHLLNDPVPEVRQAVLLVVGPPPANRVVSDESLLPALRDPDAEVRRLCEQALRSRGLGREHLKLAKLLNAPDPIERLKVLDLLRYNQDLDPGIWLRRLSHDPSPSVRAAAVRMMSLQTSVDMTDRIGEMSQSDPSPTVGYLATVLLRRARAADSAGGP